MMDLKLPFERDVVELTGTGTSRLKYPLTEGYYAIRNLSNQEIEIHIKDVGIFSNDEGMIIPARDGKLLPKINQDVKIFIEGNSGDIIHIYHSLSKFPDNFLNDIYSIISKDYFAWDGTEVNTTAEQYLTTQYKIDLNFFTQYGRYAREVHIYDATHPVRVNIKLKDDTGLKTEASNLLRSFVVPAGASLNFPDKVEVLIERILFEHSSGGTNVFNPYILVW